MTDRREELDGMAGSLSMLATHAPDAERAARVLARGRAQMAKAATDRRRARTMPASGREAQRGGWRSALEPVLVTGVSVVFLFEVFSRALHLYQGVGTNY
jgi:hypothetical protein